MKSKLGVGKAKGGSVKRVPQTGATKARPKKARRQTAQKAHQETAGSDEEQPKSQGLTAASKGKQVPNDTLKTKATAASDGPKQKAAVGSTGSAQALQQPARQKKKQALSKAGDDDHIAMSEGAPIISCQCE